MSDDRSALGTYGFDPSTLPRARPGDQAPQPQQPQPTLGELLSAGFTSAQARNTNAERERLREAYRPILEILNEGRQRYIWRPQDHPDRIFDNPGEWAPRGEGGDGTREREEARIWAEIARMDPARRKQLGLPDSVDAFHDAVTARAAELVARADAVAARNQKWGGTGARLLGGVGAGFTDPVIVATLPLGGGGRTVAQRILIEGLANGGVAAATLPITARRAEEIGQPLTPGTAALEVGGAFAFGAGVQGALIEPLAAGARRVIGRERMTDAERAATDLIEREDAAAAISPFRPGAGTEAHLARLDAAMAALNAPPDLSARARLSAGTSLGSAPPPRAAPAAPPPREAFKSRVRGAESSGDDAARNPRSSATGRYQFTERTWLRYHRRVVGGSMTDAQRLGQRTDGAVQERLMDALTADNAAALARIGAPETAGNLYLMHFAGQGGAGKILRAAPDTPIERLLKAEAIAANPFLRGKTAEDVIAWAHARMNEAPHAGPQLRRDQFADDAEGDAEWRAAQRAVDEAEGEMRRVDAEGDVDPAIAPGRGNEAESPDGMDWEPGAAPIVATRPRIVDALDAPAIGERVSYEVGWPRRTMSGVVTGSYEADGRSYLLIDRGDGLPRANVLADDARRLDAPARSNAEAEYGSLENPTAAMQANRDYPAIDSAHAASMRLTDRLVRIAQAHATGRVDAGLDYTDTALRNAAQLNKVPLLTATGKPRAVPAVAEELRGLDPDALTTVLREEVGLVTGDAGLIERARFERPEIDVADFRAELSRYRAERGADALPDEMELRAWILGRGGGRGVEAAALERFDDPYEGPGTTTVSDSLEHDIRMLAEAEPDRAVQLGDGDPQRLDDVLRELDEDEAAIAAARACMVPAGGAR